MWKRLWNWVVGTWENFEGHVGKTLDCREQTVVGNKAMQGAAGEGSEGNEERGIGNCPLGAENS